MFKLLYVRKPFNRKANHTNKRRNPLKTNLKLLCFVCFQPRKPKLDTAWVCLQPQNKLQSRTLSSSVSQRNPNETNSGSIRLVSPPTLTKPKQTALLLLEFVFPSIPETRNRITAANVCLTPGTKLRPVRKGLVLCCKLLRNKVETLT
jgi:hypothetical protein